MDVISFSDTRARLKHVMDRVVADRTPVVVTRQKAESVVIVSMTDWASIEETLYLLGAPVNARRLEAAISELDAGKGVRRNLVQP